MDRTQGLERMAVSPVPRLALRAAEAAKALGVSERTLWDWHADGVLPSVRRGRLTLFPVSALTAWLEQQASTGVEPGPDGADADGDGREIA